jgi:hypothetical protein
VRRGRFSAAGYKVAERPLSGGQSREVNFRSWPKTARRRRAPRGVGTEPELEHLSNEQLQTSEIDVSRPSDVGALSSL